MNLDFSQNNICGSPQAKSRQQVSAKVAMNDEAIIKRINKNKMECYYLDQSDKIKEISE